MSCKELRNYAAVDSEALFESRSYVPFFAIRTTLHSVIIIYTKYFTNDTVTAEKFLLSFRRKIKEPNTKPN